MLKLFIAAFAALSMGSVWACSECDKHGVSFHHDEDAVPVDVRYERDAHFQRDGARVESNRFEQRQQFVRYERPMRFVEMNDYEPENKYHYTKPAVANRLQNEENIEWDECGC